MYLFKTLIIIAKYVNLQASQMALVVENLPANAGDIRNVCSIPGSGRSPGGGHGNPLQYSCLENPMIRGAWWATVRGVSKSRRWLKQLSTCTCQALEKKKNKVCFSDLNSYYVWKYLLALTLANTGYVKLYNLCQFIKGKMTSWSRSMITNVNE